MSEDRGIFGVALSDHDRVVDKIEREGLLITFDCHGCGAPTAFLIEWPELVAMKYGLNPADAFRNVQITGGKASSWTFDLVEQRWQLNEPCPHGKHKLNVGLSPDEPERHLSRGRRAGFINIAAENQVSAMCSQLAASAANRG